MTIPDLEFQWPSTSIGDAAPWLESATKISPTVAFESESFFLSKATCVTKPVVAPQSRSKIASLKLPPGSGTSRTRLFPQAEEHEDVTQRRLASADSRTTASHLNCLADALVAGELGGNSGQHTQTRHPNTCSWKRGDVSPVY